MPTPCKGTRGYPKIAYSQETLGAGGIPASATLRNHPGPRQYHDGRIGHGYVQQRPDAFAESIGEVKVLTQAYQAEYGRSSGMQVTAVTKSGTNQHHGAGYGIFTDTAWIPGRGIRHTCV